MEELVINTLGNIGVPAALCFYTLYEVKRSVEKLTDAFNRFSDVFNCRIQELEADVRALKGVKHDERH